MPHSIFMGRPWPTAGEPFFLKEDTDLAIALAEEERDTCPLCGFPKAWCRDPEFGFLAFDAHEETCGASHRLAMYRESDAWTSKTDYTRAATALSVRFRAGHEPPVDAGLDLAVEGDHPEDDSKDRQHQQEQHGAVDAL